MRTVNMYWIISRPDNNPLTGEVLLQQDTGFWAHAAPVLSFSCSICSIGVALYVAYRARQLTQQQRDIAEQGRQIAQDKLNVDVFDKRYKIYLAYHDFYGQMVTKNYDNHNNIREDFSKFLQETSAQRIIFEIDDVKQLNEVKSRHVALFKFRWRVI
ncbi:hypothetical protein HK14_10790 [Acetobacter cibinongensis]|uniref:Uncharacterized protein n=2 Tax=Acetobacter cibinongensis TaxID=146475 RepID=A0A1Z5YYG8_9PROT|nr:hypothetical protein HK14_10790 [Acetobacter cibinongensis]